MGAIDRNNHRECMDIVGSKRRGGGGGGNTIESSPAAAAGLDSIESEPLYCLCNQVAYGDMIACDNEDCLTEWFHLHCVKLTKYPKGTWLCPRCA